MFACNFEKKTLSNVKILKERISWIRYIYFQIVLLYGYLNFQSFDHKLGSKSSL